MSDIAKMRSDKERRSRSISQEGLRMAKKKAKKRKFSRSSSSSSSSSERKSRKSRKDAKKRRRSRASSSSSDSSSSSSSRSSSSSSSSSGSSNSSGANMRKKKEKRKKRKKSTDKKKKKREKKRKKKEKKRLKKKKRKKSLDKLVMPGAMPGPSLATPKTPDSGGSSSSKRVMKPMTKEEWEKQQSVVRRVYDPETGRERLIKGDGEVVEEIVSKERQKEINKQATMGDGAFYAMKAGINKF